MVDSVTDKSTNSYLLINGLSAREESCADPDAYSSLNLKPGVVNHSKAGSMRGDKDTSPLQDCLCSKCCMQIKIIHIGPCPGLGKCKDTIDGCASSQRYDWPLGEIYGCPFPDCQTKFCNRFGQPRLRPHKHLESHIGSRGSYHCTAKYCSLANKSFKRRAELMRHCEGAHCKVAKRYRCHVIGCKYRDTLSFVRKDKLTSHVRNVHTGHVAPGQGLRKLKPKAEKGERSQTSA